MIIYSKLLSLPIQIMLNEDPNLLVKVSMHSALLSYYTTNLKLITRPTSVKLII